MTDATQSQQAFPRGPDRLLLIGAGPGLSQSIARRFGQEASQVALVARSADKLAGLVAELGEAGVGAAAFPGDAGSPASLTAAIGSARKWFGDPTVLVYNVSVWVPGTVTSTPYDDVVSGLAAGALGLIVGAQQVAPAMRAAGRGTILVTGSVAGRLGSTQSATLGVEKAAIRSLALSLAKELTPDGVHATTVTILGTIKPGTDFDPGRIAERYWELHRQPPEQWEPESEYGG